jgi:hypothetical protein
MITIVMVVTGMCDGLSDTLFTIDEDLFQCQDPLMIDQDTKS